MSKAITHSTPTRRQLGRYLVNTAVFAAAATATAATTYVLSRIFRVTADDIWNSRTSISLNALTSRFLMFRLDPELVAQEANAVTPDCKWLIKQSSHLKQIHHSPNYLKYYDDWDTILPHCQEDMKYIHDFVKDKMGDHLALIHNSVIAGYVTAAALGALSLAHYVRYKHAPKPTTPLETIVVEPASLDPASR
ncbi:MAG: hypothetical protein P1U40_08465 [Coxiellaceae bacterium]|nr:hypothetical protein [Coxiellaceae bacterium]